MSKSSSHPEKSSAASSSWQNHPSLQNIDSEKLRSLMEFASNGNGKTPNELLTLLLSAANGKKNSLRFSDSETKAILEVLKSGKSPAEIARINKMIQLAKLLK